MIFEQKVYRNLNIPISTQPECLQISLILFCIITPYKELFIKIVKLGIKYLDITNIISTHLLQNLNNNFFLETFRRIGIMMSYMTPIYNMQTGTFLFEFVKLMLHYYTAHDI